MRIDIKFISVQMKHHKNSTFIFRKNVMFCPSLYLFRLKLILRILKLYERRKFLGINAK